MWKYSKNYSFKIIALLFICIAIVVITTNCRRQKAAYLDGAYPRPIAQIILTKCAITGCHTTYDKAAALGLDLSSWQHLFEGTDEPENVLIPYYPNESHLFLHVNTYADLGNSHHPTMPYNHEKLSYEEVKSIMDWIQQGAPNEKGEIAFTNNPGRTKIYITNQGCDQVSIIDAETGMYIRLVEVGNQTTIESPHAIKVSPDKAYWYVVFANGNCIQKFDATTDKWIADIPISFGNWNQLIISPNGKSAFALDFSNSGRIAYIDLEQQTLKKMYSGSGLFVLPHGITASSDFKTLYIASSTGNFMYKMDVSDPMNPQLPEQVSLTPGETPNFSAASNLSIHDIRFTPDYSKYLVTSFGLNQLRIYSSSNDSLLKIINIGNYPQEIAFDPSSNLAFVSCMEDPACNYPPCKGSIAIIDWKQMTLSSTVADALFEPHGIIVDTKQNKLYIANRNVSSTGLPARLNYRRI
jgi:YVTN family beta-propeller protein